MRSVTISDIKLPVGADEKQVFAVAKKKAGFAPKYFEILKKSLDARDKGNIRWVYSVLCADGEPKETVDFAVLPKEKMPKERVLVVGSGPAGLFCAVRLLDHGILPIVIERGGDVDEREKKIAAFASERLLDTQTNIQFGEGGAGTFSDGKLNTQTHSPLNKEVLKIFVRFGAPKEILYLSKPHIGSDNLKNVVKNMREYIKKQGGEVLFHTRLEDIVIENGRMKEAVICSLNKDTCMGNGEKLPQNAVVKIPVSAVALAIGHSARDTFETLLRRGVAMHAKNFAVGVRIEHLQRHIGRAQYGDSFTKLPAADYKLVSHARDRAAFTFCMCPGGYVMPAASEEDGVVTNGMSNYARDGENANSALILQVSQADFGTDAPLGGVEFQRKLERAAFDEGGRTYAAPVQLVGDFLADKVSTRFGEVQPTYAAGTAFGDLKKVLPAPLIEGMKAALQDMNGKLRGFASPDAVLTAVESRTSSPVRIERTESMESVSVSGLYPCGEGAGYAGGITSSAADGLRVAEAIFNNFGL